MKGKVTLLGLAALCFLIGVGASTMFVADVQAVGIPGGDQCEPLCGTKIICTPDPACSAQGLSMHERCRNPKPALWDCSLWTCGCYELGCGPNCNIE